MSYLNSAHRSIPSGIVKNQLRKNSNGVPFCPLPKSTVPSRFAPKIHKKIAFFSRKKVVRNIVLSTAQSLFGASQKITKLWSQMRSNRPWCPPKTCRAFGIHVLGRLEENKLSTVRCDFHTWPTLQSLMQKVPCRGHGGIYIFWTGLKKNLIIDGMVGCS